MVFLEQKLAEKGTKSQKLKFYLHGFQSSKDKFFHRVQFMVKSKQQKISMYHNCGFTGP